MTDINQQPDTGPRSVGVTETPSSAVELRHNIVTNVFGTTSTAGPDWVDPLKINAEDASYASVHLTGVFQHSTDIIVQQFGLDIPADAIITHVRCRIRGRTDTYYTAPHVQLYMQGQGIGTVLDFSVLNVNNSEVYETLYGQDEGYWVPSDFTNGNFGIRFYLVNNSNGTPVTTYIDSVKIEVEWFSKQNGQHWVSSFQPNQVAAALLLNDGPAGPVSGSPVEVLHTAYPTELPASTVINSLRLTDLGFVLPPTSIIDGFEVHIAAEADHPVINKGVVLVLDDQIWSDVKATNADVGSTPSVGAPIAVFGSPTDKWGKLRTWTVDNINDPSFGVHVDYTVGAGSAAQLKLDQVQVIVYYHIPVVLAGALTVLGAVATPALLARRGLQGTFLGWNANLITPHAPLKIQHTLAGSLPVLAGFNGVLSGGVDYFTTGPMNGQRATEVAGGSGGVWSNISNALVTPSTWATWFAASPFVSNFVRIDTFNAGIPSNATIEPNIVVRIRSSIEAGNYGQVSIRAVLVKNGVQQTKITTPWTYVVTSASGEENLLRFDLDMGSLINTPAEINAANWGVDIQLTALGSNTIVRLNTVTVNVTYHTAAKFPITAVLDGSTSRLELRLPLVPQQQGPRYPRNFQNEVSGGNHPWSAMSNVAIPDGDWATISGPIMSSTTDKLNVSLFNLNIPVHAELLSIVIEVLPGGSVSANNSRLCDKDMWLIKQGVRVGTNKAVPGYFLPDDEGCIVNKNNGVPRQYSWNKTELASMGITRALLMSTTALDFGFTAQYITKTSQSVAVTVHLDYISITVYWTTISGQVGASFAIGTPVLSKPVPITPLANLSLTATILLPRLPVKYAISAPLSAAPVLDYDPTKFGIPFILNGSLDAAADPEGDLKIGIPQPIRSTLTGFSSLIPPGDMKAVYKFHAALSCLGVVGAHSLGIISTATEDSFSNRILDTIPPWFGGSHPNLDAVVDGLASVWLGAFKLIRYASFQARINTTTDGWLDLVANDFFGSSLSRKSLENDDDYRVRIKKEIFRLRATRYAMLQMLIDLTGRDDHVIIEPQRPKDVGAYNYGYNLGYGVAGIYGSYKLDYQAFIRVKLPKLPGIAKVGGYGVPVFGYGIPSLGVWAKSQDSQGAITNQDVYNAIDQVAPAGTIMWTNISA